MEYTWMFLYQICFGFRYKTVKLSSKETLQETLRLPPHELEHENCHGRDHCQRDDKKVKTKYKNKEHKTFSPLLFGYCWGCEESDETFEVQDLEIDRATLRKTIQTFMCNKEM